MNVLTQDTVGVAVALLALQLLAKWLLDRLLAWLAA